MRAILLCNLNATTTDERVRDVIASALASTVDLTVVPTKQRGHATHLVAGAVHEGVDAVFVLGGDGTANETIQALAGTDVRLGLIPGGSTNVFARALGLPNDPVRATSVLLEHLRDGRERVISLGRANGRYFGFNAGLGFDAAIVRHVEQHASAKRALRQAAFVWAATREWVAGRIRREPSITVMLPDGTQPDPVGIAIVANTDPYTYLGALPMRLHPQASFDAGLDLLTVTGVGTARLLGIAAASFRGGVHAGTPGVRPYHDLDGFVLRAATPQPLMVDGDYAGEHTQVAFAAVRGALRVLA